MVKEYQPKRMGRGSLLQSGIPKRPPPVNHMSSRGLFMRGVVMVTYVSDDDNHPRADETENPVAVYCDVLCYSGLPGNRFLFIPSALVVQDRGNVHSGRIWKPRAATMDMTGNAFDPDKVTNPANMDGDHVLVGFFDDSLNQPFIFGGIPHPSMDIGNENDDIGNRKKLVIADGDPDFWKHKGAFYGVDKAGDYIVDTRQAYAGDWADDGKEPDPPEDGTTGNVTFLLPKGGSVCKIIIDSGMELWIKEGEISLVTENPGDNMALASLVKSELEGIQSTYDGHFHTTTATIGPSPTPGVISPPTVTVGSISDVKSTKVRSD